ncbi:histone deacetylase HDT1-like [Rutidosis leptorrhynchoides]|uniref:histone deacetylase HDT1-like n=1 Tax=Rutidosis leptorrhynchoides TaxID=125765 RepID=UPI003A9A055D
MEFWGVEVKSGQPLEVNLADGKVLHLSQACLGEIKSNKSSESVYLHINIDGKKLVLGTLNSERLPQQLFDLVFDKNFQLSHNWKNGSVYFYGYQADQPTDDQFDSEDIDTDEEDEALELPIINGSSAVRQETKKEEVPVVVPVVANKKDGKQKVKIVEPEKDKKADSDDSDSDSDDSIDSLSDDSDDSDEDNEKSSGSDDDSVEEEETPKKKQSSKKRPNESAIKTPSTDKKAKMSTPQKTDGKKPHVATPHPSKQAVAKTPANKSNQKTPASTSDGAHSCKACNRNFKSDGALQSHNQAKHASK